MNYFKLCFGLLVVLSSCGESIDKTSVKSQMQLCEQLSEDSLIRLKGVIHITTDNKIIFESTKRNYKKTHLIPCSEHLKDYIFSYYNSFIYLKNFDEKFWVLVDGQYITTDTLVTPREFLFNFVAILDESEAMTDSNSTIREIDTLDIFESNLTDSDIVINQPNEADKRYYKYEDFLTIKYYKPNLDSWIKHLKEIQAVPINERYIMVAYKNNKVDFIKLFTEPETMREEKYTIRNDTLKLEVSGLAVSAPNKTFYIYKNSLLTESHLYMGCSNEELALEYCPYRIKKMNIGRERVNFKT